MQLNDVCSKLQELQYRRKFFIKAKNKQVNAARSLVLRAMDFVPNTADSDSMKGKAAGILSAFMKGKAIDLVIEGRVGPDLLILQGTVQPLIDAREQIEKEMRSLVKELPAYPFMQGVAGFGDLGLAVLVGETGNLFNYSGPRKVHKRLGLGVYKDKAPSSLRVKDMTSDDWQEVGYSPQRLAQIYSCITEPLFKHQSMRKGPYRQYYDMRIEKTRQNNADWYEGEKKLHGHMDALRIMTKNLVLDTWCAWHGKPINTPVSSA